MIFFYFQEVRKNYGNDDNLNYVILRYIVTRCSEYPKKRFIFSTKMLENDIRVEY